MNCLIINADTISAEISGNETEAFKKIKEFTKANIEFAVMTTMSALLRGIYLTESNVKINRLQSILELVQLVPELVNFKKENEVAKDVYLLIQSAEELRNDTHI